MKDDELDVLVAATRNASDDERREILRYALRDTSAYTTAAFAAVAVGLDSGRRAAWAETYRLRRQVSALTAERTSLAERLAETESLLASEHSDYETARRSVVELIQRVRDLESLLSLYREAVR